jgi:hypothetical protein
VLSCRALITYACQRTSVTVATLFTEGAPGPYTLSAHSRLGGRRAGLKGFLVLQEMLHAWRATSWTKRSMLGAMR